MVHVSEVAPTLVKEIRGHVTESQTVRVEMLNISDGGKVNLPMKRAAPSPPRDNGPATRHFASHSSGSRPSGPRPASRPGDCEWQVSKKPEASSFEEMMSRFRQTSDGKISDLKRCVDSKRGGSVKYGGSSK